MISSCDALVVGAGPAGLATSRELSRPGVPHVVLERGDQIGETWANLYDNLVLHTAKRLSALPGLSFPASTPRFPTRRDFLAYLHRYAETFRIPVETRSEVVSLQRAEDTWIARTATGAQIRARTVVVATGVVANPYIPELPGHRDFGGRLFHSVEYRRPDGFKDRRVLVVGAGNSAGEISVELATAGAHVTLAVRTGAFIVPREIAGIPIQYFSVPIAWLPKRPQRAVIAMMGRTAALVRGRGVLPSPPPTECPNVPLIGLRLGDLLRAGTIRLRGAVTEFTTRGVRFSDGSEEAFDAVILATGYQAAVGMLRGLIHLDECGFALRREKVVSVDQPGLYFVGHNYDIRGALFNIGRDGPLAAGRIKSELLRDTSRRSTERPPQSSER